MAGRMIAEGHKVTSLTGSHQAGDRDQTIDDFRDGKTKVLITTNVIARGIDISQVNLVVNYDLPLTASGEPDVETYLHRIGTLFSCKGGFVLTAFRPYWSIRTQGCVDQLCSRQSDVEQDALYRDCIRKAD